MLGQRSELRKGGWDAILETAYQFGRQADGLCNGATCAAAQSPDNNRNLTINAWALRSWLGYTWYDHKWKPRLAVNLDYASGDGNANCAGGASAAAQTNSGTPVASTALKCKTANTFENFFPTNHIHMGYADVIAWKNMLTPQLDLQFRPSERDHFEIWYVNMNLANAQDNWYRAGQGVYTFSKVGNTKKHIGDEIDFTWTRMFADGNVALQATYAHIFAGGYLTNNLNTGTSSPSDQSWGFVQLWMNF